MLEVDVTVQATATLSDTFQLSIPEAVVAARRWQAGQVFALVPSGSGMLLVPVPRREGLTGLAAGADPGGYRDRLPRP